MSDNDQDTPFFKSSGVSTFDAFMRQVHLANGSEKPSWHPDGITLQSEGFIESRTNLDDPTIEIETDDPSAGANISQAVIGLIGVHGVLPQAFTEDVLENDRSGAQGFMSIFEHRLAQLLYAAFEKHQLALQVERGETDTLPRYLLDIAGLGTDSLLDHIVSRDPPVTAKSIRYFSGLTSMAPRSGAALQQIMAHLFRVPVLVSSFYGRWYAVPERNRARLDTGAHDRADNGGLGIGAILGGRYFDHQQAFLVAIGPCTFDTYLSLRGELVSELEELVLLQIGLVEDAIFGFSIEARTIPPARLSESDHAACVGVSCWLGGAPVGADAADTPPVRLF